MRENAPLGTMMLDSGSGRPDEIVEIDIALLRVPLRRPVKIAIAEIPFREFNVVRVGTADGTVGTGYARGGVLVDVALRECIAPRAIGAAADGIELLWEHIYRQNIQVGRRGAVLRAMSAFDIALWDVRARRAGLPLWRLLGGTRRHVPVYASGGYYGVGRDDGGLRAELELYRDSGFAAVKIKVAGGAVAEDARRVELVREVMGDAATVMVDANCGYDDRRDDAFQMAQELRRLGVRFFEEPFGPDRIEDLGWLAGLGLVPIASGEQESTRWAFEHLAQKVHVLQPDVTVVGGITEWLRVAAVADRAGLPLAPHYFPEVHAQLAGACPGTERVEYFLREMDIVNFDDVVQTPLVARDGVIELGERPGVGLDLDPDAFARYRVR
jgi:D-arabinonate dehydratase